MFHHLGLFQSCTSGYMGGIQYPYDPFHTHVNYDCIITDVYYLLRVRENNKKKKQGGNCDVAALQSLL